MKKILSFVLAVLMVMSGLSFTAFAEYLDDTVNEDGFIYFVREDGTAEIRDYENKEAEEIEIPATLGGHKVEKLAVYSFSDCLNLKKVTIPKGVTWIADGVFSGCESLSEINIPDTVETIGAWVFADCNELYSITIPKSVTKITHNAFSRCNNLSNIKVDSKNSKYDSRDMCNAIIETKSDKLIAGCRYSEIPDTVKEIAAEAFSSCYTLEEITIPDSVETIGDSAFLFCNSLKEIKIPDSVKTVGEWAFSNCTSLTKAEISNSLEKLSGWMFADCSSLIAVTIPNSVKTIDTSAFVGCSSLSSVTIPESVKVIGDWAFCNCSSLSSVTLSDSLEKIGEEAFSKCVSLKNVVIPKSVKSIGYGAFYGCGTEYVVILNPECDIKSDSDHSYTVMKDTVVYGLKDSTAEEFARANSLTFEPYCKAPEFSHEEIVVEGIPSTDYECGTTDGLECGICGEVLKEHGVMPPLKGYIGDVDGDREVSIIDATAVQLHVARVNIIDDSRFYNANADKDDEISIMDATQIQLFVARIITEF